MALPPHGAVKKLWATSLYAYRWAQHESEAPGIREYLYGLRDQQPSNIASNIAVGAKSQAGLYESDFDLLSYDHSGLKRLSEFIQDCVKATVIDVNDLKAEPEQLDVEIRDSWYHITNGGGFHDSHFHGGCSWCGIYYLQIGDSGGRPGGGAPNGSNRFYSPLATGGRHEDLGNRYLGITSMDPPISDGMLLLFPSYLLHSGLAYEGEQDRIVISVNTRTYPTQREPA